jgi:hypothetical protein
MLMGTIIRDKPFDSCARACYGPKCGPVKSHILGEPIHFWHHISVERQLIGCMSVYSALMKEWPLFDIYSQTRRIQ